MPREDGLRQSWGCIGRMQSCDVIVVGLGGMGSAAAMHLARGGARVVGFDPHPFGHARGSSHGQTRLIRQAYFEHPDYVPLLRRAYALWDDLGALRGEAVLHRTGLVLVGPESGSQAVIGAEYAARHHGIPVEALTAAEANVRFAPLAIPEDCRVLWEPGAGYLDVEAAVVAHLDAAVAAGAELRTGEAVTAWRQEGAGVVVETGQGTWRAGHLVLATGAWSGSLLADLGVGFSVHRNLLLWLGDANGHRVGDGAPCFAYDLPEGFFYGFPGLDARGVKVAHHLPGTVVTDPDLVDRQLHPADVAPVEAFARRCLPALIGPVRDHAVCLYEMSIDGHFVVDVHPRSSQVVVAAGFSGHGFKFASVIGEVVARTVREGRVPAEAAFLGIRRFLR